MYNKIVALLDLKNNNKFFNNKVVESYVTIFRKYSISDKVII